MSVQERILGALILDYVHNQSDCLPTIISKNSGIDTLVQEVAKKVFLSDQEETALSSFFQNTPSAYKALQEKSWKLFLDEYDAKELVALHSRLGEELAEINKADFNYPFDLARVF